VIKTAKEMGIKTVAVYSIADNNAVSNSKFAG
jgi:acetyl/propionyl-CoA carboxylase alpha subunit